MLENSNLGLIGKDFFLSFFFPFLFFFKSKFLFEHIAKFTLLSLKAPTIKSQYQLQINHYFETFLFSIF